MVSAEFQIWICESYFLDINMNFMLNLFKATSFAMIRPLFKITLNQSITKQTKNYKCISGITLSSPAATASD